MLWLGRKTTAKDRGRGWMSIECGVVAMRVVAAVHGLCYCGYNTTVEKIWGRFRKRAVNERI